MQQELIEIPNLKVLGGDGIYRSSDGLLITKDQKIIELYFDDESFLKCTFDHKIKTPEGWKTAKELKLYDTVLSHNDNQIVLLHKEISKEKQDVYDLINVENTHSYIANNVQISNCIVLDEYAYVPNGVAEEFFSSVYPTISSGKNTKAILISTPKGLNHFYKTWTNAQNGKNGYVPVEAHWYDVPGRDEKFKQETIANTSEAQWRTEYLCDFVGSENTLITPSKIANMVFGVPQTSTPEGLDIYEPPQKNHIYAMCIDTSRGEEQDYHAISIIDCTKMPYRQVAKFKNNTISYQVVPHHIKKLGDMYNEALALFEINDLGQAVAEILHEELEYGNILSVSNRGKRGQKADGGFGSGKVQMGVRMSYQIKKMGCSLLKDMIENDKLIIQDFDTISEFSTFVARGAGYEANEGYNDDLISTLVLFGWLTTQSYFKDYTNSDVRQRIYEEQIRKIEEQVMPFGFFNDGDGSDDDNINIFDDRSEKQRRNDDMELWKD
jgi:hypothetical protein